MSWMPGLLSSTRVRMAAVIRVEGFSHPREQTAKNRACVVGAVVLGNVVSVVSESVRDLLSFEINDAYVLSLSKPYSAALARRYDDAVANCHVFRNYGHGDTPSPQLWFQV